MVGDSGKFKNDSRIRQWSNTNHIINSKSSGIWKHYTLIEKYLINPRFVIFWTFVYVR